MKTTTFIALGLLFFAMPVAEAQIHLDTIYIRQLKKAPMAKVAIRYRYYPNLQVYYDTQIGLYICQQKGKWITSETIDVNTRGYSIKNGAYKMINDYTGDEPYLQLAEHKLRFPADYSSRPTRKTVAIAD